MFCRRLQRSLSRNLRSEVGDFEVATSGGFWVAIRANKKYYETQNYFASRVTPDAPIVSRIHGTPGYPFAVTLGITFHPLTKTR